MFKAIDIYASSMLADLQVKFQYAIVQPHMTMDGNNSSAEISDNAARSDVYVEYVNGRALAG